MPNHQSDANESTNSSVAITDDQSALAGRLLVRAELRQLPLDRKLVPPKVAHALDAAGLGAPSHLAPAALMTLAAISAAAGRNARVLAVGDGLPPAERRAIDLSLRVELVAQDRHLSVIPAAILAGASAVDVSDNYEAGTRGLLDPAAVEHQLAIEDRTSDFTVMGSTTSMIGVLTVSDCETLHEVSRTKFASTVFAAAAPPTAAGDSTGLIELMREMRDMCRRQITLHLPWKADMLADAWERPEGSAMPPLSDYLAGLPHVASRLAGALHLASICNGDCNPQEYVPLATFEQAMAIINSHVVPTATTVLGPASATQSERDARRIIDYHRKSPILVDRLPERRVLVPVGQKPTQRLNVALTLPEKAGLLVARHTEGGTGGPRFDVASSIFEAE